MAATAQDVRNVDWTNSLALVSDDEITCVLADEVACHVNAAQFGDCADRACALVAAHIITLGLRGATSPTGPVTAESAGGLSRSYGSAPGSEASGFWQSTTFGQRYWAIASTRCTSPMVLHVAGVTPAVVA
jgi:hypothetical protein